MLRFALMLSLVLLTVAGIAAAGVWAALVALGAISASAGVRGLALVILVAGAGCLVLIVRTTRRRFAPIAALIGAAEQIERGDYSARVPERGGRDVRALARTFNTMSERLSAVDSQRRSFLADVAHELRTPLAIMRGRLEAMLDGIHPRDDDHLRAVLGHAAALERLVGDVATVAAAEAGALPLNLQQIDLAVLANSVADDFAETARQTGADIRVQVDSNAATVSGDAARLRQALANLVANALHSGGAVVEIGVARTAEGTEISVRDNGAGIAPELLPHIFDRFVRGPESAGSGLGLAIVADIAAAHGGSAAAASTPGVGTTITLLLPEAGALPAR